MSETIKLSAAEYGGFFEVPVLWEDEDLLAVNKPAGLVTAHDRMHHDRSNLIELLHEGIEKAKPWAVKRGLTYLMNAHRVDLETTGVLLLARSKPVLVALANLFGSEKPCFEYLALVKGSPAENHFEISAGIAPHHFKHGLMRVDPKRGKRSRTHVDVVERFASHALLKCRPLTQRPHQVRVHLRYARLPIAGDRDYGGAQLLLSSLKKDYRLKPEKTERPLISTTALHLQRLSFAHPISGNEISIEAPLPKDMTVALKYLRRYAPG